MKKTLLTLAFLVFTLSSIRASADSYEERVANHLIGKWNALFERDPWDDNVEVMLDIQKLEIGRSRTSPVVAVSNVIEGNVIVAIPGKSISVTYPLHSILVADAYGYPEGNESPDTARVNIIFAHNDVFDTAIRIFPAGDGGSLFQNSFEAILYSDRSGGRVGTGVMRKVQ